MVNAAPAMTQAGPPSSDDWVDERVIVRNTFIDIDRKEESDEEEGCARSPAHRRNLSAPPSPSKSRVPDSLEDDLDDDEAGDGWALVWAGDNARSGAEVTPSRLPLWVKAAPTMSLGNSPKRLGTGSPKRIPTSPKRWSDESCDDKPPSLGGMFDSCAAATGEERAAEIAAETPYFVGPQPTTSPSQQMQNTDGLGACTLLTQRWNEYADPSFCMGAGMGVCQDQYSAPPVLGTAPVPGQFAAARQPAARGAPPPTRGRGAIAGPPPGVWKTVPR